MIRDRWTKATAVIVLAAVTLLLGAFLAVVWRVLLVLLGVLALGVVVAGIVAAFGWAGATLGLWEPWQWD